MSYLVPMIVIVFIVVVGSYLASVPQEEDHQYIITVRESCNSDIRSSLSSVSARRVSISTSMSSSLAVTSSGLSSGVSVDGISPSVNVVASGSKWRCLVIYFFFRKGLELSSIDEFKPASIDKASTLQHLLNLILAYFYTHSPCTPCSANAVNCKEQQLGLCGIQKIDPQRHPTKEGTVPSDIDSIQESVATVTIPADVVRLPQHTTYSSASNTCNNR
ncbi:hypothetical protein Tco_1457578 [Tanacetum coccineum]